MTALPPALTSWRDRGRFLEVFGRRVFVLDEGERNRAPWLVLHGFPTSSYDFRPFVDLTAAHRRVVVHDHVGFGLSEKPADYSYSLHEQADMALGVWRALGIQGGHLLAHDYGTSVATELLARRERELTDFELHSLVLCNGSIHIEMARLTASQRVLRSRRLGPLLARLANRSFFEARLRALLGDPTALPAEDMACLWAATIHGGGRRVLPRISIYLDERRRFHARWVGALTRLDVPCLVLWGRRDPIAVAAIARRLAAEIPTARLQWLEDLGHYPMLEDPRAFTGAVAAFVA